MLKSIPGQRLPLKRWAFPLSITSCEEFDRMVDAGAIRNFEPDQPLLSRSSNLLTVGSCFAQNIAKCLSARGYNVHRFDIQERLFTPFALHSFMQSVSANNTNTHDYEKHWDISSTDISALRSYIANGATAIITLGLSIAWFDNETDEMIFDPGQKSGLSFTYDRSGRYEMRQTSVHENVDAILGIVNAIREIKLGTKVILTLSPIPLRVAACDNPVLAADAVSKSVLRVALDEVMQLRLDGIYYFPSFEIIKWLAPMVASNVWFEDNMLLHVNNDWIAYTMSKFMQYYCEGEQPMKPPIPSFPDS